MLEAPHPESDELSATDLIAPSRRRRRSVRRAVDIDVSLESAVWDGSVVLRATDVSNEGMWVETPYALSEGEELVVSFELPAGAESARIWAIAEVARVALWRRRGDMGPSGMGLAFVYCSSEDRTRLRAALQGLPPPLPDAVEPEPSERRACARQDAELDAPFQEGALPLLLELDLASE